MKRHCFLSIAFITIFAFTSSVHAQGRRGRAESDGFNFRLLGPQVGNRVAAIAGVAGDPNIWYAGAASGGVWRSTDGGNDWEPVFDKQHVAAIGALAVAPGTSTTVWAGTGEAWAIRDIDVIGDGIYKTTDGGKTWSHMGLEQTGRIGRIVVDPKDTNTVFVCALGRLAGPQQERGVYKTTDGGQHWDRVLFADANTGCSGLAIDPKDSNTLIAGMWQVEMHTWGEYSGGPGSAVYITHDAGKTWKKMEKGLPHSPLGKIDVTIAPSDSQRMYALIQTADQGSLWRSEDGGDNWKNVSWDRSLIGRAGYYIRLAVSPADQNEVLVSNSGFHLSKDGGETFREVPWGGDNHDIWIDPTNADRFAISNDAGVIITTVHGRGFKRVTLPIGQIYHVAVDNQIPYYVYANMQDNGTMRGPSIPITGGYGSGSEIGWDRSMGGCESGFTLPDLTNPNIVWSSCYGDEVTRWDAKSRLARSVAPWLHTLDSAPNQTKYRCHWTPPLAIDPFDHDTVYYGCQLVFKTTNSGQSWSEASPDLSLQDPTKIVSSGGVVGDNLGQFYGDVVFAIAPSQIKKGLVWAGTNDGQIWYTEEGGGMWTNVTKNLPGLPPFGTITSIEPSHFNAGTAYVTVDLHLVDNRDPYIYKTTDFGKSWILINSGLPKGPLAYVRNVSEDPNVKGLLFAGTGNALYYSLNDGTQWTQLEAGLPHSPVTWTVVQKQFHDLVVSTYGRGFYILDDISPLEQMAEAKSTDSVRFFKPRPTFRIIKGGKAFLYYSLDGPSKGPVTLDITDAAGKAVRHLVSTGKSGINRISWDLHFDGPELIALRTTPPENPYIWYEPRFHGLDSRPITHWGISPNQEGPQATSGEYNLKLVVDGKSYEQKLTLLRDPGTHGSDADIAATVALQLRICGDVTKVSRMVNKIEWMRKQLEVTRAELEHKNQKSAVLKQVLDMDEKLKTVEYKLVSEAITASDDKYYVSAYKLYMNLLWLNGVVGTGAGDVAGGADYGPTDTAVNLTAMLEKDLTSATAEYSALMSGPVPAFNHMLAEQGLTPLVAKYTSAATQEEEANP